MRKEILKRTIALVALGAVTVSTLAGCSKAESKEDGKVVEVVLCSGQAPYAYADEEGKPAGFDYEVLKLIDEKLPDYTFNYSVVDQDSALVGVQQGTYDLCTASFFKTAARQETYECSTAFNFGFTVLVSPESNPVDSWEACEGLSMVPVTTGDGLYAIYTDLTTKNPDVNVDFEPSSAFVPYAEQFTGLNEGRWDFAIEIEGAYSSIADEFDFKLHESDYVGAGECVYLMTKGNTELATAVNGAIDELIKADELAGLSTEYLGKDNYEIARNLGYIE